VFVRSCCCWGTSIPQALLAGLPQAGRYELWLNNLRIPLTPNPTLSSGSAFFSLPHTSHSHCAQIKKENISAPLILCRHLHLMRNVPYYSSLCAFSPRER
jgi:hypothetical protein